MRAWFRARGLPPEVHDGWRASLTDRPGAIERILAWARTDDGFMVGSPALLSVGDVGPSGTSAGIEPPARPDEARPVVWRHVGWHEIEHGGWNAESRSLSWTTYAGRRGRVGLADPGRLPELFRERVAASIVVERFVPVRGERGVTVTARRDLAGAGGLTWHSTLTRGLSWRTEGVTEAAEQASAELQQEYGPASQGW